MQIPSTTYDAAQPGSAAPAGAVDGTNFDRRHAVETGRKFGELAGLVRQAGLMDFRPKRYLVKIALNTLIFAAGLVAFFELGNSWWQLVVALWMGFYGGQSAFLWHDAAHKAMFRSKAAATFVGRIHANLVNGVSYGWWVNHHNRHHSFPNHLDNDPDIGRRTVIFDISQYASRKRGQKLVIRYQGVLFFVLLVLEGVKMHRTAVNALRQRIVRGPWVEGALLLAHAAIFIGVVFAFLPPEKAILFIVVQQATLGVYFGMLFAPNHKGMPVRSDEESLEWLERQVLTSRNIKPSPLIDFLYGGLNYQVEHHLFPTMPQMNLGKCRTIVRAYCERNAIPYHEVGFVTSYREVSSFLHEVSAPVRAGTVPTVS
jgi:fatty acid desaturase